MRISSQTTRRGSAMALGLALICAAGPGQADLVGVGRSEGGGLSVGVNAGGIKAGVSVGGSSVASAKASVGGTSGVNAGATVGGAGSVAKAGATVGNSVKAGAVVGGASVASARASVGTSFSANATVGGSNLADVAVSVGNTGVGTCVGSNCGTPGTTPGTPVNPGTPPVAGVDPLSPPVGGMPPKAPKMLACASVDGNTTAFNGYPLTDRQGRVLGIVHSAQLGNGTQIETVSFRDIGKGCTTLKKGGFTVAGYAIKGSFDAQKMGLAFQ